MKIFKFRGGIHPNDNKEVTAHKKIEKFRGSKILKIPLLQHIGIPCKPLVKVGDKVSAYQKIADVPSLISAPIHSPVSGTVIGIETLPFPLSGKVPTIIIENDFEYFSIRSEHLTCWDWRASKEQLLELIRENGLVGMGGAAFPTHVKLNPQKENIKYLILNGAECEPYLNADNRTMIEYPDVIIQGINIMQKILEPEKTIIGIEKNKPEAIEALKKEIEKRGEKNIEVVGLHTMYPQGGEKQLIKALLNKEVPSGKLPSSIGVVVQNVVTALRIYFGVIEGVPVIKKVVTVSGGAVKKPGNYLVEIGTSFKEILDYAEVDRSKMDKLVMGGPMMGIAQPLEDVPVIKGTSGLLALTKEEVNKTKSKSCILCGKCVSVCPMGLEPLMYAKLAEFNQWDKMKEYNVLDCIECGSCAYICPSKRPLTEAIRIGKAKARTIK